MSTDLGDLDPDLQPWANLLLAYAIDVGLSPVVTSTLRSVEEQTAAYIRWKTGLSKYPAAAPGRSAHEFGLAFDVVAADLGFLGFVWESWGGTWGGRMHPIDPVHFEAPGASAWLRSLSNAQLSELDREFHGVTGVLDAPVPF